VVTPPAAELKAPEAVTPPAAELKAPEVVTPPAAEVKAPEAVTPPAAEVKAPEAVTPPAAAVKAPEVIPPQEVDIVIAPRIEPVRVSEPNRIQTADAVDKADASTGGSGDAAGRKTKEPTSTYETVAPEVTRPVDEVPPPSQPESVDPRRTVPPVDKAPTKHRNRARPQELRAEDDDLYAGLDARTRRQIEQEEAEWRQERGRKPGKGRHGKKRGRDDEY
jgi:hypothetical protein